MSDPETKAWNSAKFLLSASSTTGVAE
jgi:hypothetical protein